MSGLAAIFNRDGRPVEWAEISAMLTAVPYRGPDGMRIHCLDFVAMGHATMAVTPEDDLECQPLVSPRTGCVLSSDARLDNRADLLARLPEPPGPEASDGDLILRAYDAWGVDAVRSLLGDFAFVLWDPRRQRLVCARDTSGQRTLFYRVDTSTFAAASEIHQLLQDPAIPIRPNEDHIRQRLAPWNLLRNEKDSASTYFEGVFAVPAGHVLTVDRETCSIRRYWELEPPAEIRYRTDDEYAEHYRALFFDVVRSRLRSSRPVGVQLSGGLDSSSIACTAQSIYRQGQAVDHGFTSFSFVFEGLECDERPFIEDIQKQYGFEAHYLSPGESAGRLQLEPRGFREAPNLGLADARDTIFGAISRAGVRALLTGDIGDACVLGSWLVFDSLLRRGDLTAFRRYLRAYRGRSNESLRKIVLFACLAPLLPLPVQKRLHMEFLRLDHRRNGWRWLPSWMPEPLRDELRRRNLLLSLECERNRRFSNDAREQDYRLLYPPEMVRHPVPWPLEIWRPFADRRLHEFLLAIPPEQKFEPHADVDDFYAGSKRLVRRAMRGILPESIRTRTSKTVFEAVWEQEIERQWTTYEAAFGPSAQPRIALHGYVDRGMFWSRLNELRARPEGPDMLYVFEMIQFETWLRSLEQARPNVVTVATASGEQLPVVQPPTKHGCSLSQHSLC